jgi:hypothetical protein
MTSGTSTLAKTGERRSSRVRRVKNFAQPTDLDPACQGPAGQQRLLFGIKLLCRPAYDVSILFWNFADVLARQLREHHALAISVDELNWDIEVEQTTERLPGHRAWQHIPTDDDMIDPGSANVAQHSLQCGEVGMDVVQRRDAGHPANAASTRSSTSKDRRCP